MTPSTADPAQQKMMLFMMPVIFTVMNVFLPAGLGVYMLTNTWIGITQQTLVERYIRRKLREQAAGEIQVREKPAKALPSGKNGGGKDGNGSSGKKKSSALALRDDAASSPTPASSREEKTGDDDRGSSPGNAKITKAADAAVGSLAERKGKARARG